jgi:hypothetical protein
MTMHLESNMVSAAKPVSILRNGGIMGDKPAGLGHARRGELL